MMSVEMAAYSSGMDDDRVLRALVRNEMCEIRYCGDDQCDARVPDLRFAW